MSKYEPVAGTMKPIVDSPEASDRDLASLGKPTAQTAMESLINLTSLQTRWYFQLLPDNQNQNLPAVPANCH